MIGEAKFILDGVLTALAHGSEMAETSTSVTNVDRWVKSSLGGSETSGIAEKRIESLPPFRGTPCYRRMFFDERLDSS